LKQRKKVLVAVAGSDPAERPEFVRQITARFLDRDSEEKVADDAAETFSTCIVTLKQ
jgi:hypothetical protein